MIWQLKDRTIDLTEKGMIMGIVNVTPDSFSDGGSYLDPDAACAHALRMGSEGVDILDIGGESTRPGAESVPLEEELRRVVPVIRCIRATSRILISIDTSKAEVARAAIEAGADIINDVTALQGDPEMAGVASSTGAGVVLMHMQGTPRTMQIAPAYGDVVREVGDFFRQAIAHAVSSGINPMSIALDPGIGFGKTAEHNREILRNLPAFVRLARPLVIGVSRKSFLGGVAGSQKMEDRFWPGVALTSFCREHGAHILRVHDAKPHSEALRMTEAILGHD